MNEAETRAIHIDLALKAAGCGVVEGNRIRREYPIALGRMEGNLRGMRGLASSLPLSRLLQFRCVHIAIRCFGFAQNS